VDGVLHIASVLDVDGYLGALSDTEGRAGDGPVVGQHSHRRVPEGFGDRRDAQLEPVTVGQLDQLGRAGLREPFDVGREMVWGRTHVVLLCDALGRPRLGTRGRLVECVDLVGDVLGVVLDPAEQG
jgi:hypothetical protein